jgi:hypothetical protein
MKKTVRVTIEKEIEIDIPDEFLTEEFISEFESYMFELDDEDKRDGIFKHVAYCSANDMAHAEGVGYLRSKWEQQHNPDEAMIVVHNTVDDTETEIVE